MGGGTGECPLGDCGQPSEVSPDSAAIDSTAHGTSGPPILTAHASGSPSVPGSAVVSDTDAGDQAASLIGQGAAQSAEADKGHDSRPITPPPVLIKQLPQRSISSGDLERETDAIYRGLMQLEAKSIVVMAQHFGQYPAAPRLHRILLELHSSFYFSLRPPPTAEESERLSHAVVQLWQEHHQYLRSLKRPTEPEKPGKPLCAAATRLEPNQLQALVELHRVLLNEHHDFLLASQHPDASEDLRNLPRKYYLVDRIWDCAIHTLLELLNCQLPESKECMKRFIGTAYAILCLFEEFVPQFVNRWLEFKGDLALYEWIVLELQDVQGHCVSLWSTTREQYHRVLTQDPTNGRVLKQLGMLARPNPEGLPHVHFDNVVVELFYWTKALVVKRPFHDAHRVMITAANQIVGRKDEEETDHNSFLAAVAHLVLASGAEGDAERQRDHLQAVNGVLWKVGREHWLDDPTCRIAPSAHLGLLLCQLLLGIPLKPGRWSPMMATWAPDLVTPQDLAKLDIKMDKASAIHGAAAKIIDHMIHYFLEDADTQDLGLWAFINVILVFMRSFKTRPALLKRFGPAFHAEHLVPFLNKLLSEDEARGARALESARRSLLPVTRSPLNPKEKPGVYGMTVNDSIERYFQRQKDCGEAEAAGSTATAGETTAQEEARRDPTDDKDPGMAPDAEGMFFDILPEHILLQGHFFAPEAESSYDASQAGAGEDVTEVVDALAYNIEAQSSEQAQGDGEKGREAWWWLRDPPLFPMGYFEKSKYSFDETQVRQDCVQDAETWNDRALQILCLVGQLKGVFFNFGTDDAGHLKISALPGVSEPPLCFSMTMPEVFERDNGSRIVFVRPYFSSAEMERVRRKEEMRKGERQKVMEAGLTADEAGLTAEEAVFEKEAGGGWTGADMIALEALEDLEDLEDTQTVQTDQVEWGSATRTDCSTVIYDPRDPAQES
ncbi:uncharacterized protein E0L32_004960 [Thyridium curvatum]|uniref:Uncharacterized protein n=1 Tax=Thyridium curvatum TaxID=1093900 RepID=A0A507BD10_9PEZI|nr:uncharacterized protein E0L32_004960 [Thyridium curvatum]TPX14851.1 hypothetical protein E0L32_004960 [Thyridium curvatum]